MQNARDRLSTGILSIIGEPNDTSLLWLSLRPLSFRYSILFLVPQSQNIASTKEYEVKMEVKWTILKQYCTRWELSRDTPRDPYHVV